MPTAMSYAIDTIIRLVEENTRLKMRSADEPLKLEVCEIVNAPQTPKFINTIDDWETLHDIEVETIAQYLAEEHGFHIFKHDDLPPTVAEVEALKVSADLIADSQQKQINLLLEDKRERMEDRERLLKRICELEDEVGSHRGRGRPKKHDCSPCMSDPTQ